MPVADTLVTRYTMDNSDYMRGAQGVAGATSQMSAGADSSKRVLSGLMTTISAVAVAYAGLNTAILSTAVAAFRKFGEYDALQKSLEAIEGSATGAASAMKVLRSVAQLPGIELNESVKSFTGLRAMGMDSAQSERILRAIGNANAIGGGGAEEFGRAMLAIRQMLTRPFVQGEELNQLAEANIRAHPILLEKYGTTDGGELKRMGVGSRDVLETIISSLEKMPKAGNSARNTLENFQATLDSIMVAVGGGVATTLVPFLTNIGAAVEKLQASGGLDAIGAQFGKFIEGFAGEGKEGVGEKVASAAAGVETFVGQLSIMNQVLAEMGMWVMNTAAGILQMISNVSGVLSHIPGFGAAGSIKTIADAALGNMAFAWFQYDQARKRNMSNMDEPDGEAPSFIKNAMDAILNPYKVTPQEVDQVNNTAVGHLARIEKNTAKMADLQEMILGGGNQGRLGLSPVDLSKGRRGGTVGQQLGDLVDQMIQQGVARAQAAYRMNR